METDEGLPFAANYPEAARPLSAKLTHSSFV